MWACIKQDRLREKLNFSKERQLINRSVCVCVSVSMCGHVSVYGHMCVGGSGTQKEDMTEDKIHYSKVYQKIQNLKTQT